MRCGNCDLEASPSARFCSGCGAPLAKPETERRVVTVLFADIVGFTTLSERLDPERVKTEIDRIFDGFTADIAAFGGVVDKTLGDGIIALFGAPVAHEDDAERAVRTGLQMHRTLAAMSAELGQPLQLRVGVNTGEVLVGSSAAGRDYTAMGDVVNSAARLEAMARPGTVLVGPSTHAITKEAISYHPVGEIEVRGRQEALEAWEAIGAVRPPGARTRRTATFVGRERELLLLDAQSRLAVELSQAQLAVVYGEAGAGKTRLVEEAAAHLVSHAEVRVLEGRCVPYGEANVWWPIAQVVRHLLGLDREVPDEEIDPLVDDALSRILEGEIPSEHVDRSRLRTALLHALGYETALRGGDRLRNRGEVMLAMTHLIELELRRHPVVIVLSDMHWASEAVWELVRHLLAELSRRSLIVLITARRSETTEVVHGRFGSLCLELGPLDADAAARLVSELGVEAEAADVDELVRRSGGNPFFLEELAELVGQSGSGRQGEAGDLSPLAAIPDTLRGILAARLDRLDPSARRVLDCAAVLGRSGTRSSLRVMLDQAGIESNLDDALEGLEETDLVSLAGNRFEFVSDLIREVAYGTVTKSARAQYHAAIAQHLEPASPDTARNSTAVAIARHYSAAAEILNDLPNLRDVDAVAVAAGANRWLDQAGWRALDAGSPTEAERWFTAGIDLTANTPAEARFLYGRAKARCERRDIAGTRSDLERLEPHAAHDPLLASQALLIRGDVNQKAGDLDAAASQLREAADRLEALGQPQDHSLALRLLGMTEFHRGDDAMALAALTASRAVAAASGSQREEAWACQNLAWFAFRSGNVTDAKAYVAEASALFGKIDDAGGLAFTRSVEAWVAFHAGRWERARELVAEVLPETRRRGDPVAETMMLTLETSLSLWSGEAVRAIEVARRAQAAAERTDDVTLAVQARALEGRALISAGRVAEGLAALEQSHLLADRAGDDDSRRIAVVSNCAAAARLGDAERALRWASRFEGRQADLAIVGESDLSVSFALALLQKGSVEDATSEILWVSSFESEHAGMYAQAVGAVIAAARGALDEARTKADSVLAGSSTYLDKLFAQLARVAVAAQSDTPDSVVDELLAEARSLVAATDDRVSPLQVDLVAGLVGRADVEEALAKMRTLGIDPTGWRRAWSLAVRPGSRVD